MTLEEFDQFCLSLPHTTFVKQWGGAHVWKIGGRVFAIGVGSDTKPFGITFKCSPEILRKFKSAAGLRPAPYLASRGFTWLQWLDSATIGDEDLLGHLVCSYRLVASGLPKGVRDKLGLEEIT